MKVVAFFLFSVGFFSAQAALNPITGSYLYSGELRPTSRITVEVIDQRLPSAGQKLNDLRNQGYTCQLVSPKYRCTRHSDGQAISQESIRHADEAARQIWFQFHELRGAPQMTSQAGALTEWSVPQAFEWSGGQGQDYRALEMTAGLQKLILAGNPSEIWLNAEAGVNELRLPLHLVDRESQNRWHQDTIDAVFFP